MYILSFASLGCGKSSLLRALHGLWLTFNGEILRPDDDANEIFSLPQKAYLFEGSLIQQIRYPYVAQTLVSRLHENVDSVAERTLLLSLLRFVGFRSILNCDISRHNENLFLEFVQSSHRRRQQQQRQQNAIELEEIMEIKSESTTLLDDISDEEQSLLNDTQNWGDILSPGEQQMISFARLFWYHPRYAILDEATSSLSETAERRLYECCHRLKITAISAGHRPSLLNYHRQLLQLKPNGEWQRKEI
jgi:ABC-type uncharacterized transport system fused permease/ATPase subunit